MDDLHSLRDRILATEPKGLRKMIAVSGPPGAGKSTQAAALVEALNEADGGAALVPMDGFHLDNAILSRRGLMDRKGAPETFDADGFMVAMRRLAGEESVILPGFDRAHDISVAGLHEVGPSHRIAVVEGNYLNLSAQPWSGLADIWDLSIRLDVDEAVLRDRLVQRWRDHGLDPAAARARAEGNDMANAQRVLRESLPVDVVLRNG